MNDNTCIIQKKHEKVVLDKLIYAVSAILDLCKKLMYNFHYQFARLKFVKDGKKPELCYMDTVIYDIPITSEERDRVIPVN